MNIKHLMGLCLMALLTTLTCQAQCEQQNTAFNGGEDLNYQLYFNWKFIWIKAGTARLNITDATYQGQPAYRCHLITTGSKRTDRFFMMRDTLTSYVTRNLVPLYYRKGALEGSRYYVDEVWYSYPEGQGVHLNQRYKNNDEPVVTRTATNDACTYDMASMLLRARSFDATNYRVGQRLEFPLADGTSVEKGTLIYRGKKNFKMDDTKITYRCLVFSYVEKSKGKEKEIVTFYITDDNNHMPVRLDLFLRFGTAKAFLRTATGLRNPQTSIISK